MSHPIDIRLAAVADGQPSVRLEVLWRAFEEATGRALSRPPTATERAEVQRWLRDLRIRQEDPHMLVGEKRLRALASLSVPEKAGRVAQQSCGACETIVRDDGSVVLSVMTPIDVDPWSSQSKRDRRRIRDAVNAEMRHRGHHQPYGGDALCVNVVSVVPATHRRKDVDNLVKGLLDALEGVLYVDDAQIQCLTSRRLEYNGPSGHYLVSARAVHPFGADVVFDDAAPARIDAGRRVS